MLKMVSEYKLEFETTPFSGEDSKVFFIASDFNLKMNRFIEDNLEEIRDIFENEDLEFTYVPKAIAGDINGKPIAPTLCSNHISKPTRSGIAFSAYHLDVSALDSAELMLSQFRDVANVYSRRNAINYHEKSEDPEVLDLLYEMERIARALKMKGVKPEVFDDMLRSLEKPGSLTVSDRGDILLPDFGNVEIRLNPVEKTLYLFMLQHPEGVLPDALVGFRKDILRLYRLHTIFDDNDAIEITVDSLLAEDKNVLYSNVSRIKDKFSKKLGSRIAANYVIVRDKDGAYRISLPQEYITWKERF